MQYAVANGVIHTKSIYRYIYAGMVCMVCLWGLIINGMMLGAVCFLVSCMVMLFFLGVLLPHETFFEVIDEGFVRDKKKYIWDNFQSRWIEKEEYNQEILYHLHFFSKNQGATISFTGYIGERELQEIIPRLLLSLPCQKGSFSFLESVVRMLRI